MGSIMIWSNYKVDLSKPDATVDKRIFVKGGVHVFMNSAYPFLSNTQLFSNQYKILFIRGVGSEPKFHGQDMIGPYLQNFDNIFKVQNHEWSKLFQMSQNPFDFKRIKRTLLFERDGIFNSITDEPKCGRSTGFMAYYFISKLFGGISDITLINFNRRQPNGKYENPYYAPCHNIDEEERFFKKNHVNNIFI